MRNLFFQAMRFLGIGFLNTAVDFAVLNFLAGIFSVYEGAALGALNVVSFSVAVTHSYLWNKNWAFAAGEDTRFFQNIWKFILAAALGGAALIFVIWGADEQVGFSYYLLVLAALVVSEIILWKSFRIARSSAPADQKQFALFLAVTIVGVLINSAIVALATSYMDPLFGVSKELWLNMVKAAATGVSLVWNFLGYKVFVFKR